MIFGSGKAKGDTSAFVHNMNAIGEKASTAILLGACAGLVAAGLLPGGTTQAAQLLQDFSHNIGPVLDKTDKGILAAGMSALGGSVFMNLPERSDGFRQLKELPDEVKRNGWQGFGNIWTALPRYKQASCIYLPGNAWLFIQAAMNLVTQHGDPATNTILAVVPLGYTLANWQLARSIKAELVPLPVKAPQP